MFETGTGFEVFDCEFDRGVLAMEPVDLDDITGQVGEEGMVTPVRPQFLLGGVGESGAANDHAPRFPFGSVPGGVYAFGDLCLAVAGVVDVSPGIIVDGGDRCLDRINIGSDRHRVAHVEACQVDDRVVVPEPGIEPERQRPGRIVATGPGDEFVDEAFCASLSVR